MTRHVRFIIMSSLVAVIATAAGCGESEPMVSQSEFEQYKQSADGRIDQLGTRLATLEAADRPAAPPRHTVSDEAVPTFAPAPTPEPECTVAFAKNSNPEQYAAEEQRMAAAVKQYRDEDAARAALSKRARAFGGLPSGLPTMPALSYSEMPIACSLYAHPDHTSRTCKVDSSCQSDEDHAVVREITGYRDLLALGFEGFKQYANRDREAGSGYDIGPLVGLMVFDYEIRDRVRAVLVEALQSRVGIQLVSWAVRIGVPLIETEHRDAARRVVRMSWNAIHADFPTLQREIEGNDDFVFRSQENRVNGFFFRRWRSRGGGEHGDAFIRSLRAPIIAAARALTMPEATDWANERAVAQNSSR